MSTSVFAEPGFCWASESSTTPTVRTLPRELCGPGGGGILDVVAGTGEAVAVGGRAPVVERVVVPPEVVPPVEGAVPPPGPVDEAAGWALSSPFEETITAASAPPAASTATAAMSQAFLTRREATLARA
jgi:hypothetical protein